MKKIVFIFLSFAVFWLILFVLPRCGLVERDFAPKFGFSFSHRHATALGLDWQETFLFLLDELRPQSVRLPVYWSETEALPGKFDFSQTDWQIKQAFARQIPVVLVLGYRSFHRPECYAPAWLKNAPPAQFEKALLHFLTAAGQHFGQNPAIEAWQVENEPLDLMRPWCRRLTTDLVGREIEAIRLVDPFGRPIMLTFGGEIFLRCLWQSLIPQIEIIGVSFYPKVFNQTLGRYVETYKFWWLPLRDIKKEKGQALALEKRFWVVEFQAEPWPPTPLVDGVDPQVAAQTASPEKLIEDYEILKQAGNVERIYFWGVEWWYAEFLAGRPAMLEAGKALSGY